MTGLRSGPPFDFALGDFFTQGSDVHRSVLRR